MVREPRACAECHWWHQSGASGSLVGVCGRKVDAWLACATGPVGSEEIAEEVARCITGGGGTCHRWVRRVE